MPPETNRGLRCIRATEIALDESRPLRREKRQLQEPLFEKPTFRNGCLHHLRELVGRFASLRIDDAGQVREDFGTAPELPAIPVARRLSEIKLAQRGQDPHQGFDGPEGPELPSQGRGHRGGIAAGQLDFEDALAGAFDNLGRFGPRFHELAVVIIQLPLRQTSQCGGRRTQQRIVEVGLCGAVAEVSSLQHVEIGMHSRRAGDLVLPTT